MKPFCALVAAIVGAAALSGCVSMTPATYMVSPDIKQSLKPYEGSKAQVVQMTPPAGFSAQCRAVGDLRFEGNLTAAQFIQKAFNDELKYAGMLSDGGVKLKGTLTRLEFSSSSGLVNGYWDTALTLESSNGKSLSVESRHDFASGFDGFTACNNSGAALGKATEALIRKTIADQRFGSLVR